MQAGVSSRKQSAFTLVELAIVLVLVGLLVAGGIGVLSSIRTTKGIGETREQLEEVVRALRVFLVRNNRLPCPAIATLPDTDPNHGVEDCTSTTAITAIGETTNRRGVIPFRTLQLGGTVSPFDGWNQQYTYQVVESATGDGSLSELAWLGNVELQDSDGDAITEDGVVAIVSHGANGNGAFLANGNQAPEPPATAVHERANTTNTLDFVFRSADYSNDPANPFDDHILVLTEDAIVQPLAEQGAVKGKVTLVSERLNKIADALLGHAIQDIADPDGAPDPPGCTCIPTGDGILPECLSGCRTVQRRIPYADGDENGFEDLAQQETDGDVPFETLMLTEDVIDDPYGSVAPGEGAIRYRPHPEVANFGDATAGIHSGTTCPEPPPESPLCFELRSRGPDGVLDTEDDFVLQRGPSELLGTLAGAGVNID